MECGLVPEGGETWHELIFYRPKSVCGYRFARQAEIADLVVRKLRQFPAGLASARPVKERLRQLRRKIKRALAESGKSRNRGMEIYGGHFVGPFSD